MSVLQQLLRCLQGLRAVRLRAGRHGVDGSTPHLDDSQRLPNSNLVGDILYETTRIYIYMYDMLYNLYKTI